MKYEHQYFKLDTASKKVLDENGKELRLTGNAYRVLVFLCEKKSGTVTDIGQFLDWAKDYDENNIRQYRHKINTIVGYDVVEYKNKIYSVTGLITENEQRAELQQKVTPAKIKSPNIPSKIIILTLTVVIVIATLIFSYISRKEPQSNIKQTASIANTITKPQDDMILIPAGDFIMGSTEKQALDAFAKCDEQNGCAKNDYLAEYPQHKVFVNDFYMDRKGVSNADYKLFVDATHHSEPSFWNDSNLNYPNQPVVGVNFDDANAYCQWVGKRLPTEAEREKAARGTDGRIWPWGNIWDGAKDNHGKGGQPGLDESDGFKYLAPVGAELGISPYNLLNMAGNVWEWTTSDLIPYPGNDKYIHDDFNKGFKVLKGGAYDEDQTQQRAATRYGYKPTNRENDLGFRCVKDEL